MRRKFWAAVALQVVILLAMVAMHQYTLLTGESVLLKTAPLDPWDPLRGAYVDLRYDISQLERSLPMEGWPYEQGQRVWVTLRERKPYWAAVAVSNQRPETAVGEVALRGRVRWVESSGEGPPEWLMLDYGIEQFYVPEGQGEELQGKMVELSIDARVDRTGRAGIHTVYLEGEPIEWR